MGGKIAILHYSSSPVIGGVESVIQVHASLLAGSGFKVTVIAGRGDLHSLPGGTKFIHVPEMDSMDPEVLQSARALEQGMIPDSFERLTSRLEKILGRLLPNFDHVIIHNVLTKHFNLPLTVAIIRLLDKGVLPGCIAWCHDISWTSAHSRSKIKPGYPWDALRTAHPGVTYVAVSSARKNELAELLNLPPEKIRVVYNGVDPDRLLGLSQAGTALIERLGVWKSELVMLMPVRVTQAKNIEFAMQVVSDIKKHLVHPLLLISGPPDPHDQSSMGYYRRLLEQRSQADLDQQVRFVFESGSIPGEPNLIDSSMVGELYRASDLLFMPSHREGFGMPVLEAGLVGLPVVCAEVPAAVEIGGGDVLSFPPGASAMEVSSLIQGWMTDNSQYKFRKRVRSDYTWKAILEKEILPLIKRLE